MKKIKRDAEVDELYAFLTTNEKHRNDDIGVFSFINGMKYGDIGERFVEILMKGELKKRNGFIDFLNKNGDIVELKTDSYDPNMTKNFFIERYSSDVKKNDGGLWQSFKNGSKYFLYFFPKGNIIYFFKTENMLNETIEYLKTNTPTEIKIPNKGYNTIGYKIPRHIYKPMCIISYKLTDEYIEFIK